MQAQRNGVVHKEVARTNRQEEIAAAVNGAHPTGEVSRTTGAGDASCIGEEDVHAVHRLAASGLNELGKDRLNQDLLLGGTESNHHVVVDVETQGVETEEQGDPAQVADDGFLVLKHPAKNVVLVGFRVVIADEEDRTVGERTAHQEDGDVLVVGVKSSLGRVVLSDKRIGRHRIHVLRHQARHHAKGGQGQTQLEVEGVVDGVVQTLVTRAESAAERGSLGWIVGLEDLADRMANTEVGPVHVASNHKQTANRQVVMGNVGQPKSFRLGVETTQEGKDRGA